MTSPGATGRSAAPLHLAKENSGHAITGGTSDGPIISLADVIKVYREVDVETIALRGVDLEIAPGEFVALMGRSGSGKSTLLNLLAGSDRPTAGQVMVAGVDLARAEERERIRLRGATVGIVFQSNNLVPFLDLFENMRLAAALAGRPVDAATVDATLARVGLGERGRHRPDQLSGGEQQRAAVAMVILTGPAILLADEITGELDSATATDLLDLVAELHRSEAMTVVLATHDLEVAARADRIVELLDGRVVVDRVVADRVVADRVVADRVVADRVVADRRPL